MSTQTHVLQEVAIITPEMTIWSGGKKMDNADYTRCSPSDLPDPSFASRGAKKMVDPEVLRPLNRYRWAVEKIVSSAGVRLVNGWAVPVTAVPAVVAEIETIYGEFDAAVADFIAKYDDHVDDWIQRCKARDPDLANRIRANTIPVDSIRTKFRCSLAVYQLAGAPHDGGQSLTGVSNDLRANVLERVAADLSFHADKLATVPNGYFKSTVRTTIEKVAERLRRFAFLDPAGFPAYADALSAAVVGSGKIERDAYDHLKGLIGPVKDGPSLEAAIKGIATAPNTPTASIPASVPPAPSPEAAATAEPAEEQQPTIDIEAQSSIGVEGAGDQAEAHGEATDGDPSDDEPKVGEDGDDAPFGEAFDPATANERPAKGMPSLAW